MIIMIIMVIIMLMRHEKDNNVWRRHKERCYSLDIVSAGPNSNTHYFMLNSCEHEVSHAHKC